MDLVLRGAIESPRLGNPEIVGVLNSKNATHLLKRKL
jgi:hypothetical protein